MERHTPVKNIGILAHVDAGKTTLTEQLLHKTGVVKNPGSVDKGTTYTDSLEVEKQRGISVKASDVNFTWKDVNINIIDTPGHVDFSGEVQRAIRVLDGAVLLISAVEGVEPQTEVYFNTLKTMKTPTIIFINKIDRVGADALRVLNEVQNVLTCSAVPLEICDLENPQELQVESIFQEKFKGNRHMEYLLETMADKDEELLQKYLEEENLSFEFIWDKLKALIAGGEIYPVIYGATLKGIGVLELLDLLIEVIPFAPDISDDDLSALVFKIHHDSSQGKASYVRLFSGKIRNRDVLYNHSKGMNEKVTQIKKLQGIKEVDVNEVHAGEIARVFGLSKSVVGDVLGNPLGIPDATTNIALPLMTTQVFPKVKDDYMKMVEAFLELEEEDPLLNVEWVREKNELHLQIMGTIQLEILENILKSRFGIQVFFGKPSVIYKETPSSDGIGFERYTMPKPCWAVVKFEIKPLPQGSGLVYESKVRTEKIKQRYQNEIQEQLPITLKQGLYGWEVVDLKVILIDGEDHVMHSNPGDFHIATAMGIMNGLKNIGTTLLEPIIGFRISVPEQIGGKVLNDIVNMRGNFHSTEVSKGTFTVEGKMPVATSLDYPVKLGITSHGKGVMTTKFSGYSPIPLELGKKRERVGVNPLDRAKYILYARNAIN
jgi:ribosomal protection tetracycline resistance protein